ncbi:MAG: Smr/MutS family protein [Spirochaetaceae bacterium]|nr:Smr/MutS family protein [Spirochaetaceae bacterium]
MNEHSMRLLDFPRIQCAAADYCISDEGRRLMQSSRPVDDVMLLQQFKLEMETLCSFLGDHDLPALGFPVIDRAMQQLGIPGLTLESEDLFALGTWAKSFDILIAFLAKVNGVQGGSMDKVSQPADPALDESVAEAEDPASWARYSLQNLVNQAPKLSSIYRVIHSVFDDNGELRDLPPIRRAREAVARANKDILYLVDSYRNDPAMRSALQNEEAIQRDGRTVLAVRANFKGRVPGIVHEISATGQTIFVEPPGLVEKNNELVQKEAQLKTEIYHVLKETSEKVREDFPDMEQSRRLLARLDVRLARAAQCNREKLVYAGNCNSGFSLWKARHPFLGKKAVPIDVMLPEETRTLIVTGPNTGGKTVTLKTIGLLAMMNQFGLAIPAAEGTKFAIFDDVLADIGDEQSIDQSLSTFSGHMKVIADVAKKATSRSLVLLDELGAGTDPEEGCAIAMGLLDYFIEKGSLTIITTHHGVLKKYGYTKPGCLNASMEFDAGQLAPTYRIVMGIPGESRAIEIAAQTGLQPEIVEMSKHYLSSERTDIGELITSLGEKQRELERLEREQRRRLKEAVEDQRKADLAALKVRQKEVELRQHGVSELRQLLSESRKTLENLVKELRENGGTVEQTREVKQFLADLSEKVDNQYLQMESERTELSDESAPLQIQLGKETRADEAALREGLEVLYGPRRQRASLVRKSDATHWVIQVGSLKMKVSAQDLFFAATLPADAAREAKTTYDVELAQGTGNESPGKALFEMDLRGYRLAEALKEVERQIDAASLQGLSLFSIVHGTGEGILSKGIHEYLGMNPAVADYHFARPEEGGYGKTVVRLKA